MMILNYIISFFLNLFIYQKQVDTFSSLELKSLNEVQVVDINGNSRTIGEFSKDKIAVLFVNTASSCGLTNTNYKQLVELYERHRNDGLEILGFPCNQFRQQENKCEAEIKKFTSDTYNVEFPLFSKIDVNGNNTHELYLNLKSRSELNEGDGKLKNIPWNFAKFLVNENGDVVKYYPPDVEPLRIEEDILVLLNKPKKDL